MRFIKMFKFNNKNWHLFIICTILTIIHSTTFSFVPLFSEYLLEKLELTINPDAPLKESGLPAFIINFVNKNPQIMQMVISIITMFLLWQFIRYTLMFFESKLKGVLNEKVARQIRIKMYDHIQNLSYDFHNNVDSGDLIQRVTTDIETTSNFITYRSMDFIFLLTSILSGSFQMFFVNKSVMFVTLLIMPITAISSIFYFRKIDGLFKKIEDMEANLTVTIQENVSAAKVVRTFTSEDFEISKMEEKNINYKNAEIKAGKMIALFWGFMDFLMMFQYLVVLLMGIYFASKGKMSVSSISALLMLAGMLIWPVRGLGRIINDFGKALVSANRIYEIRKIKDEYENDGKLFPQIKGNIIFDKVKFKYENKDEYLLKNISFEIKEGMTVAIIGKTGSGKSTIINLLSRMYEYEGSIKIDGIELKEINKKHLRKNIGMVLQSPFLYTKSLLENITIANKDAKMNEINHVVDISSLKKDIDKFDQGYETLVGEKGETLSGGQRQRIAIARILLSKKKILIFDDALSALDINTESEIKKSLAKEKKTKIIITHRITTAANADKIIVLKDGIITNVGKHEKLIKEDGLYKNLWDIQSNFEKDFTKIMEKRGSYEK